MVFILLTGRFVSRSGIAEKTGSGKSKVFAILSGLETEGYINVTGNGRGTKYTAA